jgi:hypothetical protein
MNGLAWLVIICSGMGIAAAHGETVPLPPPRPEPEQVMAARKTPEPAVAKPPEVKTCLATLLAQGFEAEAAAQPKAGEACKVADPVRLSAIRLRGSKWRIVLPDKPLLSCPFARTYALWLSGTAAPLLKTQLGRTLVSVHTGPGFDCRNMNRAKAGKLSAHAIGIAIDMDRFVLDTKEVLTVGKESGKRRDALRALQNSACKDFTTVLGPGSDAAHAEHIHIDLKRHGRTGTYRICGARSGPFLRAK